MKNIINNTIDCILIVSLNYKTIPYFSKPNSQMKNSKATIHDISKALNIDSSTVSRALNDSPRVSSKTKEKIQKMAKELGYQKNVMASNLRRNKSNTIGLIVPRIDRHFFSTVIAGIEEMAFESNFNVMICQSLDSFEREKKLIQSLSENRVDGILISISMETTQFDHLEACKQMGIPLIYFDRACELEKNTNVIIDDFDAAFKATEHLISIGCKHLVHLSGPQGIKLYQDRKNGFIEALKKHKLPVSENSIFESRLMKDDGTEAAKKILKFPEIDGVFSGNDTAAIGAMQYLKSKGYAIPEDIAFVGFSNEPIAAVMDPSLTTISQPGFEIGKKAISLLIDQILNKNAPVKPETIILNTALVKRNSTNK